MVAEPVAYTIECVLPRIDLKPKREKKIRSFYPWVQREEVARADQCEPGSVAELFADDGSFLAVGTYNSKSRFPFRVLSLEREPIDTEFFVRRFDASLDRRMSHDSRAGRRIIFSEADGLPGLIADEYGSTIVVQVRSLGMERLKPLWLPALINCSGAECVYEKSEMEGRKEEGLGPFAGELHGSLPEPVEIVENGLRFEVPIRNGLKTGHYLDQRGTRMRLAQRIRANDQVLDCFCYTGAFSLFASRAGAVTLGLDILPQAIDLARRNAFINNLEFCEFSEANAFEWLQEKPGELFDWIILDPPAIAKQKDKRDSLKWGVWKLVHSAIDHLKSGGRLIVCSCSYQLPLDELLSTIRLACSDRGRQAFLEEVTLQSEDHPFLLQFPESLYLKCAWVRVEESPSAVH